MKQTLRNITLSLPVELIREAKVYAAQRDSSLNALVKDFLEQTVSREARMLAAGTRILEITARGPYTSVDPGSIKREEAYDRW